MNISQASSYSNNNQSTTESDSSIELSECSDIIETNKNISILY